MKAYENLKHITPDMVVLESIGTTISPMTGLTYAIMEDGKHYDPDTETYIDEIDVDEYMGTISNDDEITFMAIQDQELNDYKFEKGGKLESIEKKIKLWADKMNKAEAKGDMKAYNRAVEKVQQYEKEYDYHAFDYEKGGSVDGNAEVVEVRYRGLPIDKSLLGLPVLTEEITDKLEEEFSQDLTFTPIKSTNLKPISYEVARKHILIVDESFHNNLLKGYDRYEKGGNVYDLRDRLIDLGDEDFVEFEEKQSDDPNLLYYTFKERLEDYHGEEVYAKGGSVDKGLPYLIYVSNTNNPNPNKQLVAKVRGKGDAILIQSELQKNVAESPLEYFLQDK